jgi:adenosylmethionine-8-amino-7-oxononanoate aminotransferase
MSHVFHRSTGHTYPVAVGGAGAYLIDSAGKRYLDAAGGAAVSCLGHGDAEVAAAICDHVILASPYTLAEPQLDEIVSLLGAALDVALAQ